MGVVKTSQTDPLIINTLKIPEGGGDIGLTLCPGKCQSTALSGSWQRDLGVDLEVVRAFGAVALVTLMESHELTRFRVPESEFEKRTAEAGLEWHHLPIVDGGVPDAVFEDRWVYSGLRLRMLLASGKNIVIHCRGGLGRTGIIAARLLVEFGKEPKKAMRLVREARPHSIENPRHENYVKGCKPVPTARVVRSRPERALACVLGGAVGDAFGYEVEFDELPKIRQRFGDKGIGAPVVHHGKYVVSDDTQMTLFTLEGMLRAEGKTGNSTDGCVAGIWEAYLDWYRTQGHNEIDGREKSSGWLARQPEMRVRRAPGTTCLTALGSGKAGTMEKAINDSKGCGGVMRTAPLGFIEEASAEMAFRLGAEAAALTHSHPSGFLSAGVLTALVRLLMEGRSLATDVETSSGRSALEESCRMLAEYPKHEETLSAIRRAQASAAKGLADHASAVESLGEGWVGEEALAIALYAVLCGSSYVDCLRIATNHGGDSDSTASIAGQLWGAAHGLAGMPHGWISKIDVLLPALHLTGRMISSSLFQSGGE